jgi:hypothetical protein
LLEGVTFEVSSRLEVIGEFAFSGSDLRRIVEIPRSVKILSNGCFCSCKLLESVTFEIGSLLETIDREAFHLSGLKRIVIPESVEVIGIRAFSCCSLLESVTFDGDSRLRTVGIGAFAGCACSDRLVFPTSILEKNTK